MHQSLVPERVRTVLELHGLSAREFEPGSTKTVEQAAARLGVSVGEIAKSLVFIGKNGRSALVVCAGDRKVSSGLLKKELGAKPRMADAAETESLTGFLPGSVCPFGVEGIDILLDESLGDYPVVYPAAGSDSSGVPVTFEQLLRVTGGKPCRVTVTAAETERD